MYRFANNQTERETKHLKNKEKLVKNTAKYVRNGTYQSVDKKNKQRKKDKKANNTHKTIIIRNVISHESLLYILTNKEFNIVNTL